MLQSSLFWYRKLDNDITRLFRFVDNTLNHLSHCSLTETHGEMKEINTVTEAL